MTHCRNGKSMPLLLVLTAVLIASQSLEPIDAEVTEWVQRRLGGDVFKYIDGPVKHLRCGETNLTFLTGENQCVKEEDLFRGNFK